MWSLLPLMPTERFRCQAGFVTYPNGDKGILVAGGYNGETSAEFLNLDTLIWEPRPSLPVDIYWGASVPFQDSFLIVGGLSETEGTLDTIYYYNPITDQWDLLRTMNCKRDQMAAFLVPDSYSNCL